MALQGQYLLDNDTLDSSGNGRNLTNVGVTFDVSDQKVGTHSGVFDGASSASVSFNLDASPFTSSFGCWVKVSAYPGGRKGIFATAPFFLSTFYFGINSDGTVFLYRQGSPNYVDSTSVIPLDTWTHVIVTNNLTTTNFYFNNGSAESFAQTRVGAAITDTALGNGFGGFFTGKLDDAHIYNHILTSGERTTLYERGAPPVMSPVKFYGSPIIEPLQCYGVDPTGVIGSISATLEVPICVGNGFWPNTANLTLTPLIGVGNGFWPDTNNMELQPLTMQATGENVSSYLNATLESEPLSGLLVLCDSEGVTGEAGVVEADIEPVEFDGTWYEDGVISSSLEPLSSTGSLLVGFSADIDVSLTALTSSIDVLTGEAGILSGSLQLVTSTIPDIVTVDLTIPTITGVLSGLTGESATGVNTLKLISLTASVINGQASTIIGSLNLFTSAGSLLVGQTGSMTTDIKRLTISANFLTGTVGTVDESILIPTSSAVFLTSLTGSISAKLPVITMQGNAYAVISESLLSYIVNLNSRAVTKATGYPFRSMAKDRNGKLIGSNGNGIYRISGDTLNGSDIDSYAVTGLIDLGTTNLKRMVDGYVTLKNSGTFNLSLKTDDGDWNEYTITDLASTSHTEKVNLGRGAKGKYWQIKFANSDGADFQLESLELRHETLKRKMRGR